MTIDPQDALASASMAAGAGQLRQIPCLQGSTWADISLITHIPKNTAPQSQKDALERWSQRAGSGLERDLACSQAPLLMSIASMYSRLQQSCLDRALTRRVHGRSGMMDWLDLKGITSWALKKAERDHRKWRGQPVSTPEVYPTGCERK